MNASHPPDRPAYLERVARVQAHIHAHLDEPLDLDRLAELACLSRFHWHRIYRAITGETIAQTVRRLRLARAAQALAQTGVPITDIAHAAGYTSQAAFTRAFTDEYQLAPALFRVRGPHADLMTANQENDAMAFPIEIRELPERDALAMVHHGPYPEIGRTFDRLFISLKRSGLSGSVRGVLGAYTDDPDSVPADDLRSHACVFVDPVPGSLPDGVEHQCLGGGSHAVLRYRGPYAAMKPAYDWLLGTWLPQSGREARDAPVLEINLNTPDTTAPPDLITEICLPLEPL